MAKNDAPASTDNGGVKGRWGSWKEYFSAVWAELKKVHWPERKQLVAYTVVVIFAVALVALIVWLFDSGLSFLLEKLFNAFA